MLRYDVFVFLIDYIEHPVHTWTLLFAYLAYGGFGLAAAIGLWFRKTWEIGPTISTSSAGGSISHTR